MTDTPPRDEIRSDALQGAAGVVARLLVRAVLIALALVLWQVVRMIVSDWIARTPLSPIRGHGVPHGHPVRWGAHDHLVYALLLLALGSVALVTTLTRLAFNGSVSVLHSDRRPTRFTESTPTTRRHESPA